MERSRIFPGIFRAFRGARGAGGWGRGGGHACAGIYLEKNISEVVSRRCLCACALGPPCSIETCVGRSRLWRECGGTYHGTEIRGGDAKSISRILSFFCTHHGRWQRPWTFVSWVLGVFYVASLAVENAAVAVPRFRCTPRAPLRLTAAQPEYVHETDAAILLCHPYGNRPPCVGPPTVAAGPWRSPENIAGEVRAAGELPRGGCC